jgi:hypothetical protein
MAAEAKKPTLEQQVKDLTLQVEQQRRILDGVENKTRATEAALSGAMIKLHGAAFIASLIERFLDRQFTPKWDRGARKEASRRGKLGSRCQKLLDKARRAYDLNDQEKVDVARELQGLAKELGVMATAVREVVLLYTAVGEEEVAVDYIDSMLSKIDGEVPPELGQLVQQLLYRCQALAEKSENEPLQARIKTLMPLPTN